MRAAWLVLVVAGGSAWAQQGGGNLQATLAKLDATSARFESAQADVHKDLYTYAARSTDAENGQATFIKAKSGMQVGLKLGPPDQKTMLYQGGTARVLDKTGCVQTFQVSGHEALFDTFISLGFGGSGKELEKNWTITDKGEDAVNGVKAEKLDLVARDAGVRNTYTHVEIWIDLDRAVSLKQVFYTPVKDTQTATYTNIRLNEKATSLKPYTFKGAACPK